MSRVGYYQLTVSCDVPGCEHRDVKQTGVDETHAEQLARESGWQIDERDLCPTHAKESRCASVDLSKANYPIIVSAAMRDPTYAPYCMRCSGLHRMQIVEPFLWKHDCGAAHDERQVLR